MQGGTTGQQQQQQQQQQEQQQKQQESEWEKERSGVGAVLGFFAGSGQQHGRWRRRCSRRERLREKKIITGLGRTPGWIRSLFLFFLGLAPFVARVLFSAMNT